MTFGRLLWRNLIYHWRGNSAVSVGVVVGTAVLIGALLVGDSLRGSLRDLTLRQLAWVDQAMIAGRFFRAELADELATEQSCAILLLQGTVRTTPSQGGDTGGIRRAGKVAIYGVDARFWNDGYLSTTGADSLRSVAFWESTEEKVVLNATLADDLGVKTGDTLALRVQKTSAVARESWLGNNDTAAVVQEIRLTVADILPEDSPGARFNMRPSPLPPRNAFVPLRTLQKELELKGQANAILVGATAIDVQSALATRLTLDDWGLELSDPASRAEQLVRLVDPRNRDGKLRKLRWEGRVPDELARRADAKGILARGAIADYYRQQHAYLSLESRQVLIDDVVARAAEKAAAECGMRPAPTLVYLANTIAAERTELGALAAALDPAALAGTRAVAAEGFRIPYSIVAALDPSQPPPLGPFMPADAPHAFPRDGIVLADWQESPLTAKAGEQIVLRFFEPVRHGGIAEESALFRLVGRVPLSGVADDPNLTPKFPGITDRLDIGSWNPPFPYDNSRMRAERNHDYWKRYRTTPKAYVSLAEGQKLWGSRYGRLTSIRLAPNEGALGPEDLERFRRLLLANLSPEQGGFRFDPIRANSLSASVGGTDFAGLFIGFSFFLIVSALLLVGLLTRLNLDRRAAEIGLLLATGFPQTTVRRLLLAEGGALAGIGALLGAAAALLYAAGMLELLNLLWPGGLDRSFLHLHASPVSFAGGYVGAVLVSVLTIFWAVRVLAKVSPVALLRGETASGGRQPAEARGGRLRVSPLVLWSSLIGALGCVVAGPFVTDHEMQAMAFFSSGALLLTAGLTALWVGMRRMGEHGVLGRGWRAIGRLGCRNAGRHPSRSLLTAGLLASAAFLIVAVDSFRRQADAHFLDRQSGSGGFPLLAESDLPIFVDLNSDEGQAKSNLSPKVREALRDAKVFAFRLRGGDDASCLNLFQPRKPRLLGVPHALVERGGFHFQKTEAKGDANPWRLLEQQRSAEAAIPVFGEANTVVWMLKKSLGDDSLQVSDSAGRPVHLRIAGLLKDSVFQSELLMSEANFLQLYPDHEGYNYFLIDVPPERAESLKELLEDALADFGFEVTPTAKRLEAYLAVENTYLSTFQALGTLGLLLGALGLAVVLVRSIWERRGELALLRALGYRKSAVGWLVLAENCFLLALGLGIGTAAALVAVAPHLLEGQGQLPILRLVGLLAGVLLVGLLAGALATASTLRAPLVPALRRE